MERNENGTLNSLQKLTDFETRFGNLLEKDQLDIIDFNNFSKDEQEQINERITNLLNTTKLDDHDKLLYKLEKVLHPATKNQIWERNHNTITATISNLMQEYGRMPTASEIANKSELSRQTVTKHLKEYGSNPLYLEKKEQFVFMTDKVLAKVFQFAVNGDIGAAKLYFNVMGCLNAGSGKTIQNNNFIQINNTILKQETIEQLEPEQIKEIEAIVLKNQIM